MIWFPLTILSLLWTALKWVVVLILIALVLAFVLGGIKTLKWLASFVLPSRPKE